MRQLYYKSKITFFVKLPSADCEVRVYTTCNECYLVASLTPTETEGIYLAEAIGNENGDVLALGRVSAEIWLGDGIVDRLWLNLALVNDSTDSNGLNDVITIEPYVVVSAYDIAIQQGFIGTKDEWLLSLKQPALDAQAEAEAKLTELAEAESLRVEAEAKRVQSESVREANEEQRKVDVAEAIGKMDAKATELTAKVNTEVEEARLLMTRFVQEENNRASAEYRRESAEVVREDAETERNAQVANLLSQTNETVNTKLTEVDGKMSSVDEQMQSVNSDMTALTEGVNTQVSTKLTELTTSTNNAVTSLNERGDAKIAEVDSKLQEIATYESKLYKITLENKKLKIENYGN